jgi:hypothetical protein
MASSNILVLDSTDGASSPTCKPKFKLAYGSVEQPPARVVNAMRTPHDADSASSVKKQSPPLWQACKVGNGSSLMSIID